MEENMDEKAAPEEEPEMEENDSTGEAEENLEESVLAADPESEWWRKSAAG